MREVKDAELARAWVECRWQVLGAITRSFPTVGSLAVEAAVEQRPTASWNVRSTNIGPLAAQYQGSDRDASTRRRSVRWTNLAKTIGRIQTCGPLANRGYRIAR
jgi:hypothetical protein